MVWKWGFNVQRRYWAWALLPFMGSVALSHAGQVLVTSQYNTRDKPFEIFFADESSTDKKELAPGIYYLDDKDKSIPLIKGNVLGASRRQTGVLIQGRVGADNGTYESIAIVDGKLQLFAAKKGAVWTLGQEGLWLSDPLTQRNERMPLIESLDAVEFISQPVQLQNGKDLDLILMSVKNPASVDVNSDGVTFAFLLDTLQRGKSSPVLHNKLFIIDRRFRGREELKTLHRGGSKTTEAFFGGMLDAQILFPAGISKSLAEFELDRHDRGVSLTSPLRKSWESFLRVAEARLLNKGEKKPKTKSTASEAVVRKLENARDAKLTELISLYAETLPRLDLEQGRVLAGRSPQMYIEGSSLQVSQIFDANTQRERVLIEKERNQARGAESAKLIASLEDRLLWSEGMESAELWIVPLLHNFSDAKSGQSNGELILIPFEDTPRLFFSSTDSMGTSKVYRSDFVLNPKSTLPSDGRSLIALKPQLSYLCLPAGKEGQFQIILFVTVPKAVGRTAAVTQMLRYVSEGESLILTESEPLIGRGLNLQELQMRVRYFQDRLLFDDVSKAVGVAALNKIFLKEWERMGNDKAAFPAGGDASSEITLTPPYRDITQNFKETGTTGKRVFTKSLEHVDLVSRFLSHHRFDEKGLALSTGLYINFKAFKEKKPSNEALMKSLPVSDALGIDGDVYVRGELLLGENKKGSPVLDSAVLRLGAKQATSVDRDIHLGVVGIVRKNSKGAETLQAFVSVHAGDHLDEIDDKFVPDIDLVDLPFQPSQLEGVKIVPGIRAHSHEAAILFFVRPVDSRTEKLQGGVYCLHYGVEMQHSYGVPKLELKKAEAPRRWIKGDYVAMATLVKRIIPDAKGKPYWVVNPGLERGNPQYQVVDMAVPASPIQLARHPELLLRFEEKMDERIGSFTPLQGGQWEATAAYDVRSRFHNVKGLEDSSPGWSFYSSSDEREKESREEARENERLKEHFPQFDAFLDGVANGEYDKRKLVVLIEPVHYDLLLKYALKKLMSGRSRWGINYRSTGVGPHDGKEVKFYIPQAESTDKEARKEFKIMHEQANEVRPIVVSTLSELLSMRNFASDDGAEANPYVQTEIDEKPQRRASKNDEDEGEDEDQGDEGEEQDEEDQREGDENVEAARRFAGRQQESVGGEFVDLSVKQSRKYRIPPSELRNYQPSGLMWLATEGQGDKPGILNRDPASLNARVGAVIFATPAEFKRVVRTYPVEVTSGLFEKGHLELYGGFLTSPWFLWGPKAQNARKEIADLRRKPLTEGDLSVFPNLNEILNEITTPKSPRKHRILVVPAAVKPLLEKIMLTRWVTENSRLAGDWSYKNPNLALYELPSESLSQAQVFENFQSMRLMSEKRRVVFFGDMAAVVKNQRPVGGGTVDGSSNESQIYTITDPVQFQGDENALLSTQSPSADQVPAKVAPHMLWLIASEGNKIQPKKRQEWSFEKERGEKALDCILLATPEELEEVKAGMGFEGAHLDLERDYEIIKLDAPNLKIRYDLIESVFDSREIASLGLSWDVKGIGDWREARRELLMTFVNRVDATARRIKEEPTSAFIRAYTNLRSALAQDLTLRRKRQMDYNWFERFLTSVFPLPLQLENLEPDDPLRKIRDVPTAAVQLQNLGYSGPLELKERVLGNILKMTRVPDSAQKVPASMILFGKTSLGKTYLVEVLLKYLDLKIYDFKKPEEESQAFVLKVDTLVPTNNQTGQSGMSVDEAISHLENFLAQPNGHRGFILIDDLHKAKDKGPEVLSKLMAFIQSVTGHEYINVKRRKGDVAIEIPTRNLILFVTINPARDKEIVDRFVDNEDSIQSQIIAALTKGEGELEESALARFGDLIDFQDFPREAKASALALRVASNSSQQFSGKAVFYMVDQSLLAAISNAFPTSHAREFLPNATGALFDVPDTLPDGNFFILTRYEKRFHGNGKVDDESYEIGNDENWEDGELHSGGASARHSQAIDRAVARLRYPLPVLRNDATSRMKLQELLANNFRVLLYGSLLQGANESPEMHRNDDLKQMYLSPYLLGLAHTLEEHGELPFWDISLDVESLEMTTGYAKSSVHELAAEKRKEFGSIFPLTFKNRAPVENLTLDVFRNLGQVGSGAVPQRANVLSQLTIDIKKELGRLLGVYTRDAHKTTLSTEAWIGTLARGGDRSEAFKGAGKRLVDLYVKFRTQAPSLIQDALGIPPEKKLMLVNYDLARLFFMALDQAVAELPWSRVNSFFVRLFEDLRSNRALGQHPDLGDFLFKDESPVTPRSFEFILQVIESSALMRERKELEPWLNDKLQKDFQGKCEALANGDHR